MDVSGLNRLEVELGTLSQRGFALAVVALRKTAADIERDAKAFAPVDTGNLRASISRTISTAGNGAYAEIGPTASYGAYVEFGTSRHGPAAYMGPAFDRNAYKLEQALARIVGG